MASFEVEYSYLEPVYDSIIVEAELDNVEEKALDVLSETLPKHITELALDGYKEIKSNG